MSGPTQLPFTWENRLRYRIWYFFARGFIEHFVAMINAQTAKFQKDMQEGMQAEMVAWLREQRGDRHDEMKRLARAEEAYERRHQESMAVSRELIAALKVYCAPPVHRVREL